MLAGFIADLDNSDRIFSVESSRRLKDNWKIVVDAYFVIDSSEDSFVHLVRDDDNIQVELSWYF